MAIGSLTRIPQKPSHHPARSNRHPMKYNIPTCHHLQQPHKEPTPQSQSYRPTCHSIHDIESTCNQICNKNHTDETRHDHNPQNYQSNTSAGVLPGICLPTTWSPLKSLSSFVLQVGYHVSASIGWCRTQNNIQF